MFPLFEHLNLIFELVYLDGERKCKHIKLKMFRAIKINSKW